MALMDEQSTGSAGERGMGPGSVPGQPARAAAHDSLLVPGDGVGELAREVIDALYNQGLAHAAAARWPAAEERLRLAVVLAPHDGVARLLLVKVLAHQGRLAEAEACLEEALRREPADAAAQAALERVRALQADGTAPFPVEAVPLERSQDVKLRPTVTEDAAADASPLPARPRGLEPREFVPQAPAGGLLWVLLPALLGAVVGFALGRRHRSR